MGQRFRLMLNSELILAGVGMRNSFSAQEALTRSLAFVGEQVKRTKDGQKLDTLRRSLTMTNEIFKNQLMAGRSGITLPLEPRQRIVRVDVDDCNYFSSASVPLKISFVNVDGAQVKVIFKIGDDLRQDQLVSDGEADAFFGRTHSLTSSYRRRSYFDL